MRRTSACGGEGWRGRASLNHRGSRAERARVVEINKRQINESAETNGGRIVHGRAHSRPVYLFRRAEERGREREREREGEKGLLEAEHGPAVIKEMNGYRGADFFTPPSFSSPLFLSPSGGPSPPRSATSVRPSVPFRFAHLRGLHTGCPSIAGRNCTRSHRRRASIVKIIADNPARP